MSDRYGNTRAAKIRAAYNDLRAAIRAGDIEAAERALDRYEPWVDYVFGAPKIKAMMWTVATGYGGTSFGDYEAQTMLGEYSCRKRRDGQWSVWKGERPLPDQIFDALEAAKAAAQADYERRILSALEGYDD